MIKYGPYGDVLNKKLEEYMSEWNFHAKCLERLLDRMYESERFNSLNFYTTEAMTIIIKMKELKEKQLCEYNQLIKRERTLNDEET